MEYSNLKPVYPPFFPSVRKLKKDSENFRRLAICEERGLGCGRGGGGGIAVLFHYLRLGTNQIVKFVCRKYFLYFVFDKQTCQSDLSRGVANDDVSNCSQTIA